MAVPTVSAVKAQLVTVIKTQPDCADPVFVTYDHPAHYEPDDIIMVGTVHRQVAPATLTGGLIATNSMSEDYIVEVTVSCFRGGDQAQTVFERACTLAAAVETAVRTDPSVNGDVLQAWPRAARYEPAWEEGNKGRVAEVYLEIYVRTLI